ncbi:hypothetical protein AMTR_s00062p00173640 [Amborella trichopoda]|uniref:Protein DETOXIFICATION n=1 Tax=Amborella trichopoda TaxID=13333 RepID=U5DE21_AMBTC|nr:hypothetical protein AMTR_s00062p00173640 [Amborella trichopoda]
MSNFSDELRRPLVEEREAVLESILCDERLGLCLRVRAAIRVEMRLLGQLAAPAVAVYLLNYILSMATQIFSGHIGNLDLAAASLGNNGIQIFAYGLLVSQIQH